MKTRNKLILKKFLLASLMALELTNHFPSGLNRVYANEKEDLLLLEENDKILQLIGIKIKDWSFITFGYIYTKDNQVFLKDQMNDKLYNLTEIENDYMRISLVFTKAENILSKETKSEKGIPKEEAIELANAFSIEKKVIELDPDEGRPFKTQLWYDTFAAPGFDNTKPIITNTNFFHDHPTNYYNTVTDTYKEEEQKEEIENNLQLGLYQNSSTYPYYENIYTNEVAGKNDAMGIITKYYAFSDEGRRVATLATQKEIEEFKRLHSDYANYTWKAALYNGKNIEKLLECIINNETISYEYTTYFIDYSLKTPEEEQKLTLKPEKD